MSSSANSLKTNPNLLGENILENENSPLDIDFPTTVYIGKGKDILDFKISEDYYKGNAKFTITVDGIQVCSARTSFAAHSKGQDQDFIVRGSWGTGPHIVTVNFPNGNHAVGTDRNLFVDSLSYDGVQMTYSTTPLYSNGPQFFVVYAPTDFTTTIGSGSDTLVLKIAEDKYLVDAQFTVMVDGVQVGGVQTATASNQYGHTQTFNVLGNWGTGQHKVDITFLNDALNPNGNFAPGTDRNLYLVSATYDGVAQKNSAVNLLETGSKSIEVGVKNKLVLTIAEDAYQGDAQFTVSVDGKQQGGTYTATAYQSLGQTQDVTIGGNWGLGTHQITVNFLNDVSGPGGYPQDRNLYVLGAKLDGTDQVNAQLTEYTNGPQSFTATTSTTYNPGDTGGKIVTLGRDTVNVGSGNVTIDADSIGTYVQGGSGSMRFIGQDGRDVVIGGSGNSNITGGSGSLDFIQGSGKSVITVGTGKEIIDMSSGLSTGDLTLKNFIPGLDIIQLSGYTGTGVLSEKVVNGSTQIVLTDNTHIHLMGVSDPYSKSIFG